MIPKGRVKLHSMIQKQFIGQFKFRSKVCGSVPTIDVVTQHDDEIEGKLFVEGIHHASQFILGCRARSHIAERCKTHRA